MNNIIELLKNHRSNRNFIMNHRISEEELNQILLAMKQAPSWMNGQQYSVIVIDDQELKEKLHSFSTRNEHISTSSVFLLFLADLTKQKIASEIHEKEFIIEDDPDVLINVTTDTILAMQNVATAAESLGYGTVFCGGIRMASKELIELFDLPKYVYPLCGLSIGKLDKEKTTERIKPRFDMSVNVGRNTYARASKEDVLNYDKKLKEFNEARETKIWSQKFADIHSDKTSLQTKIFLKEQGF